MKHLLWVADHQIFGPIDRIWRNLLSHAGYLWMMNLCSAMNVPGSGKFKLYNKNFVVNF